MRSSNLLSVFILLIVICSGWFMIHNVPPVNIPVAEKQAELPNDTVERHYAYYYDSTPDLTPKAVLPVALRAKTLFVGKPFNTAEAFSKLIPGRYFRLPDPGTVSDSVDMIEWTCPTCAGYPIPGWYDTANFPLDANETTLRQVIRFADTEGRENYMLSFGTTSPQFPDPLCGRWSCGYLGVAWFREQGNKYALVAWSPCLGCFGAFQSVPGIDTIKLGTERYGCHILNANGGPGGPYYGTVHVFGPQNGLYHTELTINLATRANTRTGWYTLLTSQANKTDHYNIIASIGGDYHKDDFVDEQDMADSNGLTVVPKELIPFLTVGGKDSCAFTVERTYGFKNGKYSKTGQNTSIQHGGSLVISEYRPAWVY